MQIGIQLGAKRFGIVAFGLSATLLFSACGGDDEGPEVDCETVTVPSFANMTAFDACTGCHSSALSGGDRNGAPATVNFDTYDATMANIDEAIEEIFEGKMPPASSSATLSPSARDEIYAWGECGTPQ